MITIITDDVSILAPRELQCYQMYGRGMTCSQVAKELNLSVRSVSTYIARTCQKFGCGSVEQLRVVAAMTYGDYKLAPLGEQPQ